MGRYTKIPQNAFDALQLDAGVLLKNFDIAAAAASTDNPGFTDADIICATTGGIKPSCKPTYSDFAEDVDNAPNNLMEFKHLDSWDCKLSTTSLGTSAELIQLALGAADIDANDASHITPRRSVKLSDFTGLWWVGDKANGGFVAIHLMNALSTGGFELQTTKNGKGQVSIEITGHVSLQDQDVVPMDFYSIDEAVVTHTVTQTLTHVTSSFTDDSLDDGASLAAFLTADEDYTITSVTVTMGNEAVAGAWNADAGSVTIASVTDDVVIVATATANV